MTELDVNWRDDAACARADPDLFFPVSATGLDGELDDGRVRPVETPPTYKELIDALVAQARQKSDALAPPATP